MLERSKVYEMLTKENQYSKGWAKDGTKRSRVLDVPDHLVDRQTGQPYTLAEFVIHAEHYLDDAKKSFCTFTKDPRSIRIRMLKAASLLVCALQVHGAEDDFDMIAGVSSNKFPVLSGGLQALLDDLDRPIKV